MENVVFSFSYEHQDYFGDVQVEKYGFRVLPKDYCNPSVVIDDLGQLFIGGKEVLDYWDVVVGHKGMEGRVPRLYTIRIHNGDFLGFVCGFDLLEDGRCWYGGLTRYDTKDRSDNYNPRYFDSIEEGILFIDSIIKEGWVLTLEEAMRY